MPLTHGTQLLRRTAKAAFWQRFESLPDVTANITFRTTSDSDQETYPFLSAAPSPIEMEGSRTHKSVPEITYNVVNKKFESTLDVSYEMWRFNKLGQIAATASELGMKARAYPQKLISELINNGHSTAGPDAQFFFDDDHTDPGADYTTSQDNDLTGSIVLDTDPTDLEFATAVRAMRDAMIGFKDGQGDPVFIDPDTVFDLHVPAGYYSVANRVEKTDQLTGPLGNDLKGTYRTIMNPWLDAPGTTAAIFMFNPNGVRKPFGLQIADPITFESNLGVEDLETKDRWIGSFGFYREFYGDWRYACRYLFTTT